MFKVEFFVDDKYLAEVLRGVSGKARNLQVIPVVNAVPERRGKPNGKVKQDSEHTLGLFLKELKKINDKQPTAADAKQALHKIGKSPTSNHYFISSAIEAGALKRVGSGRDVTYHWV